MLDTVLVHAGPSDSQGVLTEHAYARLVAGARAFQSNALSVSIAAGRTETTEFDDERGILSSGKGELRWVERACSVLTSHGVPSRRIFVDDFALDTLGEVYFFSHGIAKQHGFESVAYITNLFHIPRVMVLASAIAPQGLAQYFGSVETTWDTHPLWGPQQKAHEARAIELFKKQFGDIAVGDGPAFEQRMYEVHGLYNKLPASEQKRLY